MSEFVKVGDIILAQVGEHIEECEVVRISPSGKHIQVESDDEYPTWIRILDYKETLGEMVEADEDEEEDEDDEDDVEDIFHRYDTRNRR